MNGEIKLIKNPTDEFDFFKSLLERKLPFTFSRFSDGELFIMQDKEVKLSENSYITGDIKGLGKYTTEELKHFDPKEHMWFSKRLRNCLSEKYPYYFKGICTKSDVSKDDFDYQVKIAWGEDDLTFANVFINANYPRFLNEIVPLFKNYRVVFVGNEACNIEGFKKIGIEKLEKFFPIGNNCMITEWGLQHEIQFRIEELTEYDDSPLLVLCSAASLSNIICETLASSRFSNVTCLDIGSSLNPFFDLEGWKYSRGYLQHYWLGHHNKFGVQVDEW